MSMKNYFSKGLIFTALSLSLATSGFSAVSVDLSGFVRESMAEIKKQKEMLNKLGDEKGHDPRIGTFLGAASKSIDEAEAKVKQLEALKKLPREISNDLVVAKNSLATVESFRVSGPKAFPERCLVLTLDGKGREKIKKAGLEEKTGITETFGGPNTWVLTVPNPHASDGVDRFHLDENVGMIGSADRNAGLMLRSHTPQDMSVTGLVDKKTKKVMCLSRATKVTPQK